MILHSLRYPIDISANKNETLFRPKLLLLHGMGGNGSLWRPIAAALEDTVDLLCPDQRGHGRSLLPPEETHYGPLDYGRDIAETCAAESFSPTWVLGHSMGVRTACGYAKLSPETISGLILVDLGLSSAAGGGIGDQLMTFLRQLPNHFPSRAEARKFLETYCPDPSIAQYLLAVSKVNLSTQEITFPFSHEALLKTIEASRGSVSGPWMEEFARTTGKPVYIIRGERSLVYEKSEYLSDKEQYSDIPNIHFVEFAGAGHGLPFEKRAEFVALVRSILQNDRPIA